MAMMPMKTIIVENMMLLIVLGSQVVEESLFEGGFGIVAGSSGNAMLPNEHRIK